MSNQDRKAKAAAAAPRSNRGANAIVIGGIVMVVAIVLVVGGAIWAGTRSGDAASELPQGVEKGEPIEPYADAKPAKNAPVVDIYEDFRCPACKSFEQAFGQTITQLAEDGTIRLRIHLKTVIDTMTGGESSAVAGSSAVCAADQGVWTQYHEALFVLQPASETQGGFDTGTYTQAAEQAGLSGEKLAAWQKCTDEETYVDYVQGVDDASAKEGINGTPVLMVEGTKVNWGGLINQEKQEVETDRLEEILTSGKVPEALVDTE